MSDVHFTMITLINNRNKPNVKMVMGMVRMMRIGLIKLFSSPITTATKRAVRVLSTRTPLCKRKAASNTATEVTSVFKKNLFMAYLLIDKCKVNCLLPMIVIKVMRESDFYSMICCLEMVIGCK